MNEIIYILFLLSGVLKVFLNYFHVSIGLDLTFLLAIILVLLIIRTFYLHNYKVRFNRSSKYSSLILFGLFILIIFSMFYTSSENYVYEKTMRFFTILLGFVFPMLIRDFSVYKFYKLFLIFVIVITAIFLPLFLKSYDLYISSYTLVKDDIILSMYKSYLSMGYIIAIALIINTFGRFFPPFYRIMIFLFLLSVLIVTGARGPILAFFIVLLLFVFQKRTTIKKVKSRTILILLISGILSGTFLVNKIDISSLLERSTSRLIALETVKGDEATNVRLEQIKFVIEQMTFENIFFGYGFGSFGYENIGDDSGYHPHNILFEILFELGIVGLFLYLLLILVMIKNLIFKKEFLLWALFIYLFLNSLKSSSIVDSRIMFGFFIVILLSKKNLFNNKKEEICQKN